MQDKQVCTIKSISNERNIKRYKLSRVRVNKNNSTTTLCSNIHIITNYNNDLKGYHRWKGGGGVALGKQWQNLVQTVVWDNQRKVIETTM